MALMAALQRYSMAGVSVRVYIMIIPRYLKFSTCPISFPAYVKGGVCDFSMLKDHGLGLLDVDFQPSVRTNGLQYVQLALQPFVASEKSAISSATRSIAIKSMQGMGNRSLLKPPLAESPVHQDEG